MKNSQRLLTKEQVELGAKFLAVSNIGHWGISFDLPKQPSDIRHAYSQMDYEYANELGEGLYDELENWKSDLRNVKDISDHLYKTLQEKIPFIFN